VSRTPSRLLRFALLLAALGAPRAAVAQGVGPDTTEIRRPSLDSVAPLVELPGVASSAADSLAGPRLPSPGDAFIRSMIIPGWGQAAYGHYFRGGVYFAAQSGSWFMLLKSIAKLGEARQMRSYRDAAVRDSALAAIEADPKLSEKLRDDPAALEAELAKAVAEDAQAHTLRSLVNSRRQQREDWIAWTLFWMLADGVDAFVTAHLSDFPARITAEPRSGGGMNLGVEVPIGNPR